MYEGVGGGISVYLSVHKEEGGGGVHSCTAVCLVSITAYLQLPRKTTQHTQLITG